MKFILFMMFFVAPPTALQKDQKIWALQSTTSMEFQSAVGCASVREDIHKSLAEVDTVALRSWCVCETTDTVNHPCPPPAKESLMTIFSDKRKGSQVTIERSK